MKKSIFIFLCIFLCGCLFSCTLITHFDSDKSSGSEYFDPSNFNPTADIFSSGLYYGRSLLSTQEEQKGYDLIMRTLLTEPVAEEEKNREYIVVDFSKENFQVTEKQVIEIFNYIRQDDPRIPLITSSVLPRRSGKIQDTYSPAGTAPAVTAYFDNAFKGMSLGRFWTNFHTPQMAEIEERVQALLGVVKEDMTEAQKVRALHDAFLATVAYGEQNSRGAGNLRGAFLNLTSTPEATVRRVVCQGYAVSFQYLLMRCGIQAITVTGTALSTPGDNTTKGSHAWNKVKVAGAWYLVDPTHDDSLAPASTSCRYDYFLKADSSVPTHQEGMSPAGEKVGYPLYPQSAGTDYPLAQTTYK